MQMQTSPIETEIDRAKDRFALYGPAIMADRDFPGLVAQYREAIQATHRLMQELQVVALCSRCANTASGSCCAREVETWYDDWLLFINLLLGVPLDTVREAHDHCLFVGANGCKLIARHSFCVNFLCPEILSALTPSDKEKLLAASGAELYAGWILEQRLRQWLNHNAGRDED
ncbi:hypothetical protein [Desulfoferrobacter suflitae]|uniref:hypothetical protein n=1 Tax=Desulfoferrobacter suflitae TaxID=2865782 RepID=UPI002164B1F9|nr:hypothetical protein [Desulfoferrobacter suflitae]MCK8602194.1 hypothetical protein [Desulfoferrobacter suflitae]